MMVSACVVFDVAIYPLMIWFLFIDVPDFLQSLGHFWKGNLRTPEDTSRIPMFLSWVQKGGEELRPSELTKASVRPRGRAYGALYKVSGFGLSL